MSSIKPEIKFGLNVNRSFTDISDRKKSLENLGLSFDDLEIIRGSSETNGISRNDVRTISGLDIPIQRYIVRLRSDVSRYRGILEDLAGIDQRLKGNLEINGSLAASAIKYSYIENDTNDVKKADISTSRVSSWSSTESPVLPESAIFYGGDLDVGGKITTTNLNFTNDITPVFFKDSEIPTHKIQAEVNGSTIYFYAMKGIPIIFKGFFRSMDAEFSLDTKGAISIRVVDVEDSRYTAKYENLGGRDADRESLTYRSNRPALKDVEIYHDPSNITSIKLNRLGIFEYPSKVILPKMDRLILDQNNIKSFPDLAKLTPTLTYLDMSENPLFSSDDDSIRKLNDIVVARIPPNIETLIFGNTYRGSITGDLTNLQNLKSLNLDSNSKNLGFGRDLDDPNATCPEVSDMVTSYSVQSNKFRTIPNSVKELPELVSINLYNNNITDRSFKIDSENIRSIDIGRNAINTPNMSGSDTLESLSARYSYNRARSGDDINGLVTDSGVYKFNNCSKLNSINLYASFYRGYIPKFSGNSSLSRIELYYTQLSGGRIGDDSRVLFSDTFDDCADSLTFFRLASYYLLNAPIDPDVFRDAKNISYLYIRSFNRGVTGPIPDLSGMPNLVSFYMHQNKLTGTVPRFSNNPRIRTVYLSENNLDGAVPFIESTTLTTLSLHTNKLTSFTKIETPSLVNLYLQNNNFNTQIPDVSNLSRLRTCRLNDNSFNGYKSGIFSSLTNLRSLDLSNNSLTESDINSIMRDMLENYKKSPRGRVTINIRGNSVATGAGVDIIFTLRSYGWIIRN